ncbi:acetyl-coenzyme A transporter 1-like protein, partial [Leptotrombidium deliense]
MEEVKNQDGNILTVLKEQTQVTNQGKGLKGDYGSICLLVFLYILEGIPLGILSAIPMIMASNNVAYGKQAIFTFATYPYAMKLLWAPIVDSVYWEKFGRRKSWIVPVQYLIGVTMIITSLYSGQLLGTKQTPPNIYLLTGN